MNKTYLFIKFINYIGIACFISFIINGGFIHYYNDEMLELLTRNNNFNVNYFYAWKAKLMGDIGFNYLMSGILFSLPYWSIHGLIGGMGMDV